MPEILELLTVKDLANKLGVSERTIYRYVEIGKIPGIFRPFGGKSNIRFHKKIIDEWIMSSEEERE